uniref:DUF4368 domain-containing protein n=1 Tax=Schistosoma mansoni TaxID=6183 RepID=A0A5K4F634_SCHMA
MKHLLLFHLNVLLLLLRASVQVDGAEQQAYSLNDIKGRLKILRDYLKKDQLDIYEYEAEITKQIDVIAQELSSNETVTEYVKCLHSLVKQFTVRGLRQEFDDVTSDINSYVYQFPNHTTYKLINGINVQKSSTLQECVNIHISIFDLLSGPRCVLPASKNDEDTSRLITLVFRKYDIVKKYNKHLG